MTVAVQNFVSSFTEPRLARGESFVSEEDSFLKDLSERDRTCFTTGRHVRSLYRWIKNCSTCAEFCGWSLRCPRKALPDRQSAIDFPTTWCRIGTLSSSRFSPNPLRIGSSFQQRVEGQFCSGQPSKQSERAERVRTAVALEFQEFNARFRSSHVYSGCVVVLELSPTQISETRRIP